MLGYTALRTGLSLLPLDFALAVGAVVSERLTPALGHRALLGIGSVVAAGGTGWLSLLPDRRDYLGHILAPSILLGVGLGLMAVHVAEAAIAGIEPELAGLASGLVNTARQLGGAAGLAVLVTVATSATRDRGGSHSAAVVHGYHVALIGCAVVALFTALLTLLIPASPRRAGLAHPEESALAVESLV